MHFLTWLFHKIIRYPIVAGLLAVLVYALVNWGSLDSYFGKNDSHEVSVVETRTIASESSTAGAVITTGNGQLDNVAINQEATVTTEIIADTLADNGNVAVAGNDQSTYSRLFKRDTSEDKPDRTVKVSGSSAIDVVVEDDNSSIFSRLFKRKKSTATIDVSVGEESAISSGDAGQVVISEAVVDIVDGSTTSTPNEVVVKDTKRTIFSRIFKRKKSTASDIVAASEESITSAVDAGEVVISNAVDGSIPSNMEIAADGRTAATLAEATAAANQAVTESQYSVEAAIDQAVNTEVVSQGVVSEPVAEEVEVMAKAVDINGDVDETADPMEKPSLFQKIFPSMGSAEESDKAVVEEVVTAAVSTEVDTIIVPTTEEVVASVEVIAEVPQDAKTPDDKKSLFQKLFPGSEEVATVETTETAVKTEIASDQPGTVAMVTESVQQESSFGSDFKDSLDSARTAFWRKDIASAGAIYQNLIKSDPGNPDLLGEYGNMLFQTGNVPEAIKTYDKSARMLINEGRLEEAKPLILFIGNIDRNKAQKLVVRLNEKAAQTN